jgi:hypothetical protein
MKRGKVLTMSRCRGNLVESEPAKETAREPKPLPNAGNLWELLDRNISIDIWKKGL